MGAYNLELMLDADHESGAKFYQVLKLTTPSGEYCIGHYGRLSLRRAAGTPMRFFGKAAVYGRRKSAAALAIEKKKGGYVNTVATSGKMIFSLDTKQQVIDKFKEMSLHLNASDRIALGFSSDQLENATEDEAESGAGPAVTAKRNNAGAIATTADLNPWAGTW